MRVGEDPAEVRVAALRLAEKRDVSLSDRHLRAGDRADAEVLRRVRELERAVDAVVVGERERVVAELGGAGGELLGQRGAVEERVRRVRMQLDVWRQADAVLSPGVWHLPWVTLVAYAPARWERIPRLEPHTMPTCPSRSSAAPARARCMPAETATG